MRYCDVLLWSAIVEGFCEVLLWIATVNCYCELLLWCIIMNYYTEGRKREGQNPMSHLLLWYILMKYYNETKDSDKREGHKKWTNPNVKRMTYEALIQGKDAVKQKALIQGKDTNSKQNPMWTWSDKTLCEKDVTWREGRK